MSESTEPVSRVAEGSEVILGHVEMSCEQYELLPPEDRPAVWSEMIANLGVAGAYLPIPYRDASRQVVGMNIVGVAGLNGARVRVER